MSKTVLKIVAIVLILMGIAALRPAGFWSCSTDWYGIAKIVIGAIALAIAFSDRKFEREKFTNFSRAVHTMTGVCRRRDISPALLCHGGYSRSLGISIRFQYLP